jgi:hypothetical protein
LAEGVEFLEKYAHLDHREAPFGGGGRRSKWRPAVQDLTTRKELATIRGTANDDKTLKLWDVSFLFKPEK